MVPKERAVLPDNLVKEDNLEFLEKEDCQDHQVTLQLVNTFIFNLHIL